MKAKDAPRPEDSGPDQVVYVYQHGTYMPGYEAAPDTRYDCCRAWGHPPEHPHTFLARYEFEVPAGNVEAVIAFADKFRGDQRDLRNQIIKVFGGSER